MVFMYMANYVRAFMCISGHLKILSVVLSFFLCCIIDFIGGKKKEVKKETGLGITNCKDENFGEWYSEGSFECFNCALQLWLSVLLYV